MLMFRFVTVFLSGFSSAVHTFEVPATAQAQCNGLRLRRCSSLLARLPQASTPSAD
jgi:hypothetical protein